MKSRAEHRIPGYSDADMAALQVLTDCNIQMQQAVQDMTRLLALSYGVQLGEPSPATPPPDKAKQRARWHYTSIIRRAPGHVVATVANETGLTRRLEIKRAADGGLDVEELDDQ